MKRIKALPFIKQAVKLFQEDEALQLAKKNQESTMADMSTDLTI